MTCKRHFCAVVAVACFATLPWLGLTDFHTKGEPREAVVSLTMLAGHDWILPTNNGGEMAYKPPFFHWAVAAASWLAGGVGEWTARLPSALAVVGLTVWMYVFYARRKDSVTALLASLVCLTTFEVFRAAFACRVDALLTLFVVGAMFSLAAWFERRRLWNLLLGALMMGLGTLTKGPVAVVLPCMVTWVYVAICKKGAMVAAWWLALAAALSLALPAVWYVAAYQRGGEAFLLLVMEENVGRFVGRMTYRSHENGIWYYFVMLPAGMLPWTLPVAWTWWRRRRELTWRRFAAWRQLSPETLHAVVALVVVFVFYCIPSSKRGVYLLPVYPFASWLCALTLRRWSVGVRRAAISAVVAVWVAVYAVVLPPLLNRRSDKDIATYIRQMGLQKPLLSHISDSTRGDPMHFFTIDFYLGDAVGTWDGESDAYLLIGEQDAVDFVAEHSELRFVLLYTSSHRSCDTKQRVLLYQLSPVLSHSK